MSRRFPPLLLAALCAAGCVEVAEPLGDIEKAEPDKELVGKWTTTKNAISGARENLFDLRAFTVDIPAVKDNPKGLMRAKTDMGGKETEDWFFLSAVGKETYANLMIASGRDPRRPELSKEGEFAKWQKAEKKAFLVLHVSRKGDELTLDFGDYDSFVRIMKNARIPADGADNHPPIFRPPTGWLAKYLGENGRARIYYGTSYAVLKREKK